MARAAAPPRTTCAAGLLILAAVAVLGFSFLSSASRLGPESEMVAAASSSTAREKESEWSQVDGFLPPAAPVPNKPLAEAEGRMYAADARGLGRPTLPEVEPSERQVPTGPDPIHHNGRSPSSVSVSHHYPRHSP